MNNSSVWQAYTSGLGSFGYPCYLQDNKAFAKLPVFQAGGACSAATAPLIYALNGIAATPSDMTMPQNALQKLLPQELNNRLKALYSPQRYPATCGITAIVEKIFFRSESEKEKKKIEDLFVQMNLFVAALRERIEDYVAWQRKFSQILDEWNVQNPQLAGTADDLNREIARISFGYASAKGRMKTPPYCTTLTDKIIALTDAKLSDEEKEDQCKELGRQIRIIGGNQDFLLATFRAVVKAARQDVTRKLMKSTDSRTISLLENVRAETGAMLTGRFGMEGK
jgi:hypothetical protein